MSVLHALKHLPKMDGVFAVNKPPGISSADVLRDLQRHLRPSDFCAPYLAAETARLVEEHDRQRNVRQRRRRLKPVQVKLGHGGTLDPMATGVLIVGAGRATKALPSFLSCTKTYETVVLFGAATDTYDRLGRVVARAPYAHITRDAVEQALAQFRGRIMQRPSIYSALKMRGKKLYEYAREGVDPPEEIVKRPVEVSDIRVIEWYPPGEHDYTWPVEEADSAQKRAVGMVNRAATPDGEQELELEKKKGEAPAQEKSAETAGVTAAGNARTGVTAAEPEATLPATEASNKRKASDADSAAGDMPPELKRHKPYPEHGQQHDPTDGQSAALVAATNTAADTTTTTSASQPPQPTPPTQGPPAVKLSMTVSSGFYVRSLAHDLGLALGSHGLMSSLVRTRQGDFAIDSSNRNSGNNDGGNNDPSYHRHIGVLEYTDLEAGESVWALKLRQMLDEWAARQQQQEQQEQQGQEQKQEQKQEQDQEQEAGKGEEEGSKGKERTEKTRSKSRSRSQSQIRSQSHDRGRGHSRNRSPGRGSEGERMGEGDRKGGEDAARSAAA